MNVHREPIEYVHMVEAITLAERGRGAVEPNPLVGARVVRAGVVVGEGWHAQFGGPHAEVVALQAAGAQANGADLIVTLEPCSHHGKTPPCVDAVIAAGVRRVYIASPDPFPAVRGAGIRKLQEAGIEVHVGMDFQSALMLNLGFYLRTLVGRPAVHAKWAMSLDGKTTTAAGESKWITGELARRHSNEQRGCMDAIIVGINTVLADDPLLTARPVGPRAPVRVVLDSQARLPTDAQLVRTIDQAPVLLATTASAPADRCTQLQSKGVEVLTLPTGPAGQPMLSELIAELGRRTMTNVLVEGGATVLGSFLTAGLIDIVRCYIAPILIGGANARPAIAGAGVSNLNHAPGFRFGSGWCPFDTLDDGFLIRYSDDRLDAIAKQVADRCGPIAMEIYP